MACHRPPLGEPTLHVRESRTAYVCDTWFDFIPSHKSRYTLRAYVHYCSHFEV
jgi:hypothetical protein